MPSELGEFIEEEDAMVGQRHLARQRSLPPDQPHIGNAVVGARNSRMVTKAVRLDELGLQVFKEVIVQMELPFKRAISHTTSALAHNHSLL